MTTYSTIAAELLSEPVAIPDTFASGLSHIEDLGDGNFRFTYYTRQRSIYGGEEHIIVSRVIMPVGAVYAAMDQTRRVCALPVAN